ncbi:MAG TPA: extracellular solute-binding protein, partial [Roseiflexaceae bacterium]
MRRTPPAYSRSYPIAALICVVLSLLSGCAFGSGAPATDAPQTPQQASAGSVVNLTFGASDFDRRTYQPIIEAFNQGNPNIHVQFVAIDDLYKGDDRNEQLRGIVTRVDTASAYVDPSQLKLGLVRDLKPLMDADASFAPDDFYPVAIQSLSADGGIYLAPKTIYPFLLSYNKDMWAARGLSAPRPDWSWQDLEAAAQRLAQKQGNTVTIYGLVDNTAYAHAFLGGLDLLSTPPDRLRFDRSDIAAALERVADLVNSGAFYHWPLIQRANWDAVEQLVRDQKAGMWRADITSPKAGGPAPTFAIGTAAYPASTIPGDSPFSVDGYLMSSGTQHPDEAWAWLSFLSKQAGSESGRPGGLPARKSIAEQIGYWSQLDPEAAAALRATLARALPSPLPGDVDERIFQPLAQALDDVIAGKPTAQALSEAQAALGNTIASLQLTPTPTPNTQPVVVATPVPDVAAPGAVTITFAAAGKGNDQIRKIVEQFNQANPAIFVQMQ